MIVRILGRNGKAVHDGIGGKHAVGALVDLPDDVASCMIASGTAAPVGEVGAIEARRKAIERADEIRMAEQQARAKRAMALHDNLPADVRHAVHEHGDEVTETYLAEIDRQESEFSQPDRLNRKQRRALTRQRAEGEDA